MFARTCVGKCMCVRVRVRKITSPFFGLLPSTLDVCICMYVCMRLYKYVKILNIHICTRAIRSYGYVDACLNARHRTYL
jgi:hypothetical protein